MLRSPKLPCSDKTRNHYGLSYLFTRPDNLGNVTIRGVFEFTVAFYTYDGNDQSSVAIPGKDYTSHGYLTSLHTNSVKLEGMTEFMNIPKDERNSEEPELI
jgi:hypothetical protein